MKKKWVEILVVLGINVGLLAGLELCARWYFDRHIVYDIEMSRYSRAAKLESAGMGHVHRPSVKAKLMGVDVSINSMGLRDREFQTDPGPDYRILFLGDSLTFGWGVPQDQTFKALLETALSKVRPVEILNFGIGNYGTVQEMEQLKERGLALRPQQVTVFYFINDAEQVPVTSSWGVLGNSELISFLWSRLRTRFGSAHRLSYLDYYHGLYRDGFSGWENVKLAFSELKRVTDERGIYLQVVLLPEMHDLANYPFSQEHEKVLEVLKQKGIDALDLAPFFSQEKDSRKFWVAEDDAHPNALGHAYIAKYAKAFIEKRLVKHEKLSPAT